MASRSPKRGQAKSQGPAEEKLEDKHESNLNEEDRHKLSGDIDCIIVGAGLSGLKAARDLAVRGFKVCVFESSHRVGGRCYSTVFPETTTYVDLGGEWFDVNRHTLTMEETERYNLKVLHQEGVESGKFAYSFSYPGRKIITRAEIPEDYMEEYTRISGIINNHLALFSFSKGFNERQVDYLDIPWVDYLVNTLGCKNLMLDFHLSMAFVLMGADAELYSTVHVLHHLSGFGTAEEITNTRPREGFPFEKMSLGRLDVGMSTLAERMADEIVEHGGEIRLNSGIGGIICEPVPKNPCPRYCPKCAMLTYPFCSLHGPRVRVVDGLGRQTRGRGLILAVPLKCIPAFKFDPPLPDSIKHAAEVCNIGECTKAFVLSSKVGASVDRVQSWPAPAASHVRTRYVEKLNKDVKEYTQTSMQLETKPKSHRASNFDDSDSKGTSEGRGDRKDEDEDGRTISTYDSTEDESTVLTAASSPSVREGNTKILDRRDPFTAFLKLAEHGETKYIGTGADDDRSIGTGKSAIPEDEFDENGYKVRAYAILGTMGATDEVGVQGQKLAPLLRKHHPTSRLHRVLSHDWRNDRHIRGAWMSLRAGTTALFDTCQENFKKPWKHTKNFTIIGSDVTDGWTGWIEGAIQSGKDSAACMEVFFNPPVPVANFTSRYTVGEDPRVS